MSQPSLVECVPNFSEGRDPKIIEAIADAMRQVEGASLLLVDPGHATHRTVYTLVGPPEAVLEAAFRAIATAVRLIDLRTHRGAHPRIGACDVCPFVPVSGLSMDDCVALARRLGERVGRELDIPVYLYEEAATRPERRSLSDIRAGEYEGLEARLKDPDWQPDFGPAAFRPRSGATVIGARPFLIAYNVNLNTREKRKASKIGALVRELGIARRDAEGNAIRDEEGKLVRDPGMFRNVKAIGWFIPEYDRAQISINFTDWRVSPPHLVLDAVRRIADDEGVVVTGSELVGLVPLDAMLEAGRYYLSRQGQNPGAPESELIEVAIRSMGLRDLGPFDPDERIIERRIRRDGRLVSMTVRTFVDTLSSSAPAPGGGSVAALCGAMAAACAAMVGAVTTGKKGYEASFEEQNQSAIRAQGLKEAFLADIDHDTTAFDRLMACFGLPKATAEEAEARDRAIQEATQGAALVPLGVLERCVEALEVAEVALRGNANARSDAGVATLLLGAAAEGAWYNVRINCKNVADPDFVAEVVGRADRALEAVIRRRDALTASVRGFLVS
ncbi:MAG: glutamate formimidoyltransferase [Deltaproteobacteria bacterium]|nr:glutamate formimidoyltransferase [Deltaproteobacteria bacterium]